MRKPIIQFYKDGSQIEYVCGDFDLMDLLISITKLKQILFDNLEALDMISKIDYKIETEEDKTRFMIEIIKSVEDNKVWSTNE